MPCVASPTEHFPRLARYLVHAAALYDLSRTKSSSLRASSCSEPNEGRGKGSPSISIQPIFGEEIASVNPPLFLALARRVVSLSSDIRFFPIFLVGEMFYKSILLMIVTHAMLHAATAVVGNDHRQQQIVNEAAANVLAYGTKTLLEMPREHYRSITDCIFVTSESGPFSYVARSDDDVVCGIYFLTDPDRIVEIHVHSFDVPCEHRGLLAVIDGWELNSEVFPSEGDHPLLMKERVNEFCGKNRWFRKTFTSSQNAAILQYRVPLRGKGFVVTAKYPKNPRPCNVLSVSTTDPFTLRNYGRRINCTLMAVYPGVVRVLALGVGGSGSQGMARTTETGTLRKCNARSPRDQVQIGGSRGLDTTKLDVINSICGIDSKPDVKELVAYEVTSVRLVSSGYYDNSVTVEISPMTDDDVLDPASGL